MVHGPHNDVQFWVASGNDAEDAAPDWSESKRGFGFGGEAHPDLWVWTRGDKPHDGIGSAISVGLCEQRIDSSCAP